jgi:hypothetical protein
MVVNPPHLVVKKARVLKLKHEYIAGFKLIFNSVWPRGLNGLGFGDGD